jgi:5'-nucleotidase
VRRAFAPGVAAFAAAAVVAVVGANASAQPEPAPQPTPDPVQVRLLGVNDLHGHLEPPRPGVGGVAWLKSHLDRQTLPERTIRVHAGDLVGASPLISSWFHDEPTVEAANAIGFDVGTPGNHEFDEGGDELLRLLRGGRRTGPEALKHDAGGALVDTSDPGFAGTRFPTISANVFDRNGQLVLPPYHVVERAGAEIGFLGVTTTRAPVWLLERHAAPFRFGDLSDAVNRWVPDLRAQGVEAIVVLAHEGARQNAGGAQGPILDEALQMDGAVDVVVAGHSHSTLNLRVDGKLVVEALSYGMAYDLVDLTLDGASGDVISADARILPTDHDGGAPDAGLSELVAARRARVAPLAERVLGNAPEPLTRRNGRLARLAADAQREHGQADLALVSPSSLRADLDAGPLAFEELFAAQAFDHPLLRLELEGADLIEVLSTRPRIVRSPPEPLLADRPYAVVASELLVDRLPGFRGRARAVRAVGSEVEALAAYVARHLP